MTDLVSRLLEAITETERIAREATEGPWRTGSRGGPTVEAEGWTIASGATDLDAAHIAHNDPSSVLRRCAVDRKLLELHNPKVYETDEWDESRVLVDVEYLYCPRCWAAADYPAHSNPPERFPCDHVRLLAEAYGLEVTE